MSLYQGFSAASFPFEVSIAYLELRESAKFPIDDSENIQCKVVKMLHFVRQWGHLIIGDNGPPPLLSKVCAPTGLYACAIFLETSWCKGLRNDV